MNWLGRGSLHANSAGSHPSGHVQPRALPPASLDRLAIQREIREIGAR